MIKDYKGWKKMKKDDKVWNYWKMWKIRKKKIKLEKRKDFIDSEDLITDNNYISEGELVYWFRSNQDPMKWIFCFYDDVHRWLDIRRRFIRSFNWSESINLQIPGTILRSWGWNEDWRGFKAETRAQRKKAFYFIIKSKFIELMR